MSDEESGRAIRRVVVSAGESGRRRGPRTAAATRTKLSESALELFAGKGFEQTTVAEIAARAGVTERTFFKHFETKLDAVFPTEEFTSFATLQQMVADSASELDDLDVVTRCGLTWLVEVLSDRVLWQHRAGRQRVRISASAPAVMGIRAWAQREMTEALIGGLAIRNRRDAPSVEDEVIGAAVGAVLHQSFLRWAEGDEPDGFARLASERLAVLRSLMGTQPARLEDAAAATPAPMPSGHGGFLL